MRRHVKVHMPIVQVCALFTISCSKIRTVVDLGLAFNDVFQRNRKCDSYAKSPVLNAECYDEEQEHVDK